MIQVGPLDRDPFTSDDNRVIREFVPNIPAHDALLGGSSSNDSPDAQNTARRKLVEERSGYMRRWRNADEPLRAIMAATEEDGGEVLVRTETYASSMQAFEELSGLLIAEALEFEPPVQIDPSSVSALHFGGASIRGMYGFKAILPSGLGIIVPSTFNRISQHERELG